VFVLCLFVADDYPLLLILPLVWSRCVCRIDVNVFFFSCLLSPLGDLGAIFKVLENRCRGSTVLYELYIYHLQILHVKFSVFVNMFLGGWWLCGVKVKVMRDVSSHLMRRWRGARLAKFKDWARLTAMTGQVIIMLNWHPS
jgi:hypothetical protein